MHQRCFSGKADVHEAIKNIDKGLYPSAFCKIIPDMLTVMILKCLIMHADGAGQDHPCICLLEGNGD